jgi:hypothetical protein
MTTTPRTIRASAALAAAGAYDSAPTTVIVGPAKRLRLFCTYTRGGASGAFKLKVARSPDGGTTFVDDTEVDPPTSGVAAVFTAQFEFPAAAGAGAEARNFVVEVEGDTHVRVAFAEYGNTGAPGTLAVTGVLR